MMICIFMCIINNIENFLSLIFVLYVQGDLGLLGFLGIFGLFGEEVLFNFLFVENLFLGYWMWMFQCLSVGGVVCDQYLYCNVILELCL